VAQSCGFDSRGEVVVDHVGWVEPGAGLRREDEIFCNAGAAFEESLKKSLVSQFLERSAQLTGEVHPARLVVLGSREGAVRVVALHEDVSVGVCLALTELDVSPLQRNQLAASQTGSQGCEKQRVSSTR
jgi:hypothetical protein